MKDSKTPKYSYLWEEMIHGQGISISLLSLGPHCILLLTATNLLPIILKSQTLHIRQLHMKNQGS